ncbi:MULTISPECIES: HrpB1 family type III secretion system apparatus protein [Paraburkholderia]|uniref:HrpB1 family type III secretion system apparatus protein n=1 Tax=Paraburkholderia metrosideri TaxID=580937 RepID=A0ABW9DMV8_9BURK
MAQDHEYTDCSEELTCALAELLRLSLVAPFPSIRCDPGDVDALLEALHALRPALLEFYAFDGFVHAARRDWHAAIDIFAALTDKSIGLPGNAAMLIYCVAANGDAQWRALSDDMLSVESLAREARLFVMSVVAHYDMAEAHKRSLRTGILVEPESMQRLRRETIGANADTPASAERRSLAEHYLGL